MGDPWRTSNEFEWRDDNFDYDKLDYEEWNQKPPFRSLVEWCIKILAENIQEASVEALEHLPVHQLWRVYKYHSLAYWPNIRVWRMFSLTLIRDLPRVPLQLYAPVFREKRPSHLDLPRYLELTTSPGVDFITHLTIHKVWMYRASDLMALADMPNLGILELSDIYKEDPDEYWKHEDSDQEEPDDPEPDLVDSLLNDRLVRGWSEREKPFPNLRVLLITSIHSSITTLTVQYASRFPSLVHCALRSVSLPDDEVQVHREALALGWRMEPTLDPWRDDLGKPYKRGKFAPWQNSRFRPNFGIPASTPPPRHAPSDSTQRPLQTFATCARAGVFLSPYTVPDPAPGQTVEPSPVVIAPDEPVASAMDDEMNDEMDEALIDYIHVYHYDAGLPDNTGRFPWTMPGWSLYSALGEQIGNADLFEQGVQLEQRATHIAPSMRCEQDDKSWTIERGGKFLWLSDMQYQWSRHEVLPPKPMLTVVLGYPRLDYYHLKGTLFIPRDQKHSMSRCERRVQGVKYAELKQYSFVRDYSPTMATPERASDTPAAETIKPAGDGGSKSLNKRKGTADKSNFKPRKRRDLDDIFG